MLSIFAGILATVFILVYGGITVFKIEEVTAAKYLGETMPVLAYFMFMAICLCLSIGLAIHGKNKLHAKKTKTETTEQKTTIKKIVSYLIAGGFSILIPLLLLNVGEYFSMVILEKQKNPSPMCIRSSVIFLDLKEDGETTVFATSIGDLYLDNNELLSKEIRKDAIFNKVTKQPINVVLSRTLGIGKYSNIVDIGNDTGFDKNRAKYRIEKLCKN